MLIGAPDPATSPRLVSRRPLNSPSPREYRSGDNGAAGITRRDVRSERCAPAPAGCGFSRMLKPKGLCCFQVVRTCRILPEQSFLLFFMCCEITFSQFDQNFSCIKPFQSGGPWDAQGPHGVVPVPHAGCQKGGDHHSPGEHGTGACGAMAKFSCIIYRCAVCPSRFTAAAARLSPALLPCSEDLSIR